MQSQNTLKKYWSKDNYFKNKPENKSSLKESVKGLWQIFHTMNTNIWYKLGGQSMLTAKPSANFQKLTILGKSYNNFQEAQYHFKQLLWFTYRKQVKLPSEIKSDLGWGCLIRVGQMLLANSLKRFFKNKNTFANEENLIFSFLDDTDGIQGNYSFSRILQKGAIKFNLKSGDWFNISQICFILMSLQNYTPMKGSEQLKMIYFNQTLIFIDQIFQKIGIKMCQCKSRKICCEKCNGQINIKKKSEMMNDSNNDSFELEFQDLKLEQIQETQQKVYSESPQKLQIQQNKVIEFDLLLVVSTRISQGVIDRKHYQGIIELINLPTSMGVVGGVPGKGLYFVGSCDDNLIYLDPHLVQNSVNRFNLSKEMDSFHCQNLRLIGRQKMDSSIAFAFYIRNLQQLSELISNIQKIKKSNPQAVPISYMWQNQFRDSGEFICSNQVQVDDFSPDFSFIA